MVIVVVAVCMWTYAMNDTSAIATKEQFKMDYKRGVSTPVVRKNVKIPLKKAP